MADENVCLLEIEKRKSASLATSASRSASLANSNASRSASNHSMAGSRMSSSKTQLPTSDSLDSFNANLCGMRRELSTDTVNFSLQPSNEYLESHQPHVNWLVRSLSRIYTEDEDDDYMGRPLPEVVEERSHRYTFETEHIDDNDCNISIASSVTDYQELFCDKEGALPDCNSCDNNFTDDEVAAGWHMHSIDRDPDYHSFNQVMHRPQKANEKISASSLPPPQPDKVSEKRSATKSVSSRRSSSKKSSKSLSTRKSKSSRKERASQNNSSKKISSETITNENISSENIKSERSSSDKISSVKVLSEKVSSVKAVSEKNSNNKIPSEKATNATASEKVLSKKISSEKVFAVPEFKSEPQARVLVTEAPPTATEKAPTGKKNKDRKKKGGKGDCFMDAAKQQGCANPFFNPYMFGCNPMKYIDVKECDKSGNVVMMIKKPKNKMMYYYESSGDDTGGCGGGAPNPSQGPGGNKLPDTRQRRKSKKKATKAGDYNYQTMFPNMPPMMNPMANPYMLAMTNPYMSATPNPYMSPMFNPYMMQDAYQNMQNMMAQAAQQSMSRWNC